MEANVHSRYKVKARVVDTRTRGKRFVSNLSNFLPPTIGMILTLLGIIGSKKVDEALERRLVVYKKASLFSISETVYEARVPDWVGDDELRGVLIALREKAKSPGFEKILKEIKTGKRKLFKR